MVNELDLTLNMDDMRTRELLRQRKGKFVKVDVSDEEYEEEFKKQGLIKI